MPLANSTINAKSMPLELSFDDGVTWKMLVCMIDFSNPITTPLEEDQTYCGKKIGQGPIEFTLSGNIVVETRPDTDEASFDELLEVMNTATSILYRMQNPTSGSVGVGYYLSGSVKVSELTPTGTALGLIKASITLTGEGVLTTTAP